MASPNDQSIESSGSAPTIFDTIHAKAGGEAPKTIFDKLHADELQTAQPAVLPDSAKPAQPERSLGGFASNLADSAGNFLGGFVNLGKIALGDHDANVAADAALKQAVTHPIDTGKSILNYLGSRYDGWDKIKQTAYEDPVGFAADLSSVLGGGSAALKMAAKVGEVAKLARTSEVLSSLGNFAGKASEVTNPLVVPGKAVRMIAAGPATKAATSIYQSALKPSVLNGAEDNAKITEMGLKNGIALNDKAPARARQLADGVQARTNALLANSSAQINPQQVVKAANTQFRSPIAKSATPTRDLAQFDRETSDYLAQHTPAAPKQPSPTGLLGPNGKPLPSAPAPPAPQPTSYPIQTAQSEKVNTYKKINSYGDQASPEQEANKGLAFGLKTAMEHFIPELKGLNDQEATAIGLNGALQKFASKEANSGRLLQFLKPSIASGAIAGAAGATEHSLPLAFGAHLMTKALEDPGVQSRIAIGLYKTANRSSTPYFRQIMTPAQRISEVQQHINDTTQNAKQALLPAASASQPSPSGEQPQASQPFGLPSPDQAVANAQNKAMMLSQHLTAVGNQIHQQQLSPKGIPTQ